MTSVVGYLDFKSCFHILNSWINPHIFEQDKFTPRKISIL